MRIRSPSDFWCGLLFIVVGIAFVVLARNYRLGTPARMGPGFFPTILGGILAALGLTLAIPALLRDGDALAFPRLRPIMAILVAIMVFALLLAPLGFVLAAAALILIAGLAEPELRPLENVGLTLFLIAFSVVIFVVALGLPMNLWPDL
ncbi:MAG: tripartite tricarboxylate transporter TctB family protein [Xanthobacteraceae bacterium]|nr:tripartite tricarboxylate transporter TctB family protein [Xanthobacteraceae bacterium]